VHFAFELSDQVLITDCPRNAEAMLKPLLNIRFMSLGDVSQELLFLSLP
jgi:hypothetical protein